MRIVITGANRGIGLALARHYAARNVEVHGTSRAPERSTELAAVPGVRVHALDVRDDASCAALAGALGVEAVDVLVNNAGVGGWETLDEFDGAQALAFYDTNAVGPVRVTRALLPLLVRARGKVFHIGSEMGSITQTDHGGAYAYRMSKAALGMAGRTLANDLRERGVASIVLHPGWVRTDMGGPGATLSPEESAERLATVIDARGIESTGRFYSWSNVELPW